MKKAEKEQMFEDLIQQNEDRIYRICRSYLQNKEDIPDLYQEILIQIWKSIERFRNESTWSTYIYRITINTAIKFNRKLDNKKEYARGNLEVADQPKIEEKDAKRERLDAMHSCIQELNDGDKLLIGLVLEDLSYKEIAEILDSNTNSIGVRINRAKKRIMKLMEKHYGTV